MPIKSACFAYTSSCMAFTLSMFSESVLLIASISFRISPRFFSTCLRCSSFCAFVCTKFFNFNNVKSSSSLNISSLTARYLIVFSDCTLSVSYLRLTSESAISICWRLFRVRSSSRSASAHSALLRLMPAASSKR